MRKNPPCAPALPARLAHDVETVVSRLTRRLREEATTGDLTPSQKAVLAILYHGPPATLSALARAEQMRPQSMRTVMEMLDQAGMVTSVPDPDDRRQRLWSLSGEVRERIDFGLIVRQDWLVRTIEKRLTADEQTELARGLKLLAILLEP